MSDPYVGEIRMFGGNFAPNGWEICEGQLLSIAEFSTLFELIGTTYGGDGQSTFALPDLRSRVPVHQGTSSSGSTYIEGQLGGVETVTLVSAQIPAHSHLGRGTSDAGTSTDPTGAVWASTPQLAYHEQSDSQAVMATDDVSLTGGSQPHDNMMPILVVNFIISLFGIFPTQN